MLASGTTCFLDAYLYVDAIADAAQAAGLRAVLSQGVFDIENANFKTTDAALASAAALADRLAGHDRLRAAIFPHAVYTCSAATLARCAAFARDRGLLLSTHAAETAKENDDCRKANGVRVVPLPGTAGAARTEHAAGPRRGPRRRRHANIGQDRNARGPLPPKAT